MGLVEREAELDALGGWWKEASTGEGRLVFVSGEAGIGKTTLVQRLCATVADRARVLTGSCEPLATPPALGPVMDMAASLPPAVTALLSGSEDPVRLRHAFLAELAVDPRGTLIVVEDAHWADEATLDLLRFVGRRLHRSPSMVVVTYRDDEVGPHHPLRVMAGDLASLALVRRLAVPPLSPAAVADLAEGSPLDPAALHQRTGGNPFFVTEVLAAGGGVPAAVRDAVMARATRLGSDERRVLEVAACLGYRAPSHLLDEVAGTGPEAVDACVDAGMLVADADAQLQFRHELARAAVAESVPPGRARGHHAAALATLSRRREGSIDPARLAQHAEQADDPTAVLHWARAAAEHAARLGAHRESAEHFQRALAAAAGLEAAELASLHEGHAMQLMLSDQIEAAFEATRQAVQLWQRAGEPHRQSAALTMIVEIGLMSPHWIPAAEAACHEAVAVLDGLPAGPELALSYAMRVKLEALAFRNDDGIAWAEKALALCPDGVDLAVIFARLLGAIARAQKGDDSALVEVDDALRLARETGWQDQVGLGYFWLTHSLTCQRRYHEAEHWYDAGIAFVEEHDQEVWRQWLRSWRARALFDQGRWDEAEVLATDVRRRAHIADGRAMTAALVLSRLAIRRGDSDPSELLSYVRDNVAPGAHVLAWIVGPGAAQAEQPGTRAGPPTSPACSRSRTPRQCARANHGPWASWPTGCGAPEPCPTRRADVAEPYGHLFAGRWEAAANAWKALNCPYEAALALAESGEEAPLREAFSILDRLGARPARDEVAAKFARFRRTARPQATSPHRLGRRPAQHPRSTGALAARGRPAQCRDRSSALPLRTDRRAPRRERAAQAAGWQPRGGGPAGPSQRHHGRGPYLT